MGIFFVVLIQKITNHDFYIRFSSTPLLHQTAGSLTHMKSPEWRTNFSHSKVKRNERKKGVTMEKYSYSWNRWKWRRQWRIQDFPEGCANCKGGGTNLLFWSIFLKNCMKMKTIALGTSWRPLPYWIHKWQMCFTVFLDKLFYKVLVAELGGAWDSCLHLWTQVPSFSCEIGQIILNRFAFWGWRCHVWEVPNWLGIVSLNFLINSIFKWQYYNENSLM